MSSNGEQKSAYKTIFIISGIPFGPYGGNVAQMYKRIKTFCVQVRI